MADFRVYYDAANAFLDDTQLYGKAFGVSSGFYKYSPFACLPFIPLAILPYSLASILYYLIVTVCIIWFSLYLTKFLLHEDNKSSDTSSSQIAWILTLTSLFMADHLERELHLGNVNLFLLLGAFQCFLLLHKGKYVLAGIIYGLLLLFKPHFIILLPYFIWKKQWKLILTSFVSIGCGLISPSVFKGFSKNQQLLSQWFGAMVDHNTKLEESPNTLYGIVNHFVLQHTGGQMLVVLLLGLVAIIYILFLIHNRRILKNADVRYIEYFLLIALIPNLTHTDTEHFMWTWTLIAFIMVKIIKQEIKHGWIYIALMILAFIPYTMNSPDLVGHKLRFLFDEGGLLGLANLTIIGSAVSIYIGAARLSKN